MSKRDELQRRIGELEAKGDPTPEESTELKQKRQELKKLEREPEHGASCSHKDARLEDRFCPTCGESLPALPRSAIEQIVEEVLAKREQGRSDEGIENGEDDAESDEALHKQYEAYRQAVAKQRWWQQMDARFHTFEEFTKADGAVRRSELKRVGAVESWNPSRSSGQKKTLFKPKR